MIGSSSIFVGRETMFPVTFRDDISRCVRGSESLCTLVPKRGQSSLNCRITVAETAVKKEFKIAKKNIKKRRDSQPFFNHFPSLY